MIERFDFIQIFNQFIIGEKTMLNTKILIVIMRKMVNVILSRNDPNLKENMIQQFINFDIVGSLDREITKLKEPDSNNAEYKKTLSLMIELMNAISSLTYDNSIVNP